MPRSPRRRRDPNANRVAYHRARANRVARVFGRAAAALPHGHPRPARNSHAYGDIHAPTHRHAYATAYRHAHAPAYANAASAPYANAYAYAPTYRHAASGARTGEPRGGRRARAA